MRYHLLLPLTLAVALTQSNGTSERPFRKTTVSAIISGSPAFDEKLLEVRGRLTFGFEMSRFQDASKCKMARNCSLWAEFDKCMVVDRSRQIEPCDQRIDRMDKVRKGRALVLEGVTLRGLVQTIRKDVTYDSSVPPTVRIGFGHLSACPAQILVREIEFSPDKAQTGHPTDREK